MTLKKNWLKEVVASLAAVLILAHVTGCGKKAEVVVDASSEELIASEEFGIKDEYTGGIVFGEGYSSWQEGYLAYIDEFLKADSSDYSYALIYVDDDDIPELVCESGYEAGGCTILSYYDGKVTLLQTSRLYFNYIEESGLLCNSEGLQGYYYDLVFYLKNGEWKRIFAGEYYAFDESIGPEYDEESGRYHTLHHVIDNEELDEKTYLARLNEVYDETQAQEPEEYLTLDDLTAFLSTGELAYAEHRFELVVEDCTWQEADQRCKERGGFLASMSSDEEFYAVDSLIRLEGKENYCFYIGATQLDDYKWCWTEPGLANDSCTGPIYGKHWLDGQPSYSDVLPDGTEVKEDCAEYIYRKSDDSFYINDVPNDVIRYYPKFKGLMGYICEYPE